MGLSVDFSSVWKKQPFDLFFRYSQAILQGYFAQYCLSFVFPSPYWEIGNSGYWPGGQGKVASLGHKKSLSIAEEAS